uniref:Uncharacterized protein n=1 Tax=Arundo donax TaxID=35708 RepID=A0A0A9B569_ARUDO
MVLEPSGGVAQALAAHPTWSAQCGVYTAGTPYVPQRARRVSWVVSVEVIPSAAGQDDSAPPASSSPSLKKILEVAVSRSAATPRSRTSASTST